VLLILGVPERAAMEIMGWSHSAMAARYQHLTGPVRDDIASRVGGLLWGTTDPKIMSGTAGFGTRRSVSGAGLVWG
jgi:hypothetical protein